MSQRPLRILHILNTVRETGNGIINTAMDLAWGEAKRGHTVGAQEVGRQQHGTKSVPAHAVRLPGRSSTP